MLSPSRAALELAAELVDELLVRRRRPAGCRPAACRRPCRRRRRPCSAGRHVGLLRGRQHHEVDDASLERSADQARVPRSWANSSVNVLPLRRPAISRLQLALGLPVGLHLVDQGVVDLALEGAAAEGDADREGQEDRHDRDDVVAEGDHVNSPWIQVEYVGAARRLTDDHHSAPDRGRRDRDGEGEQPGEQHQQQLPEPHPAGVQLGDALGVDELGADAQPGEEGAGQPGPLPVEELVEGGVGADRDDQAGAVDVGEQQRDVLAGAGGRELLVPDAEPLEPLRRRPPGRSCRRAAPPPGAAQRLVGDGAALLAGRCPAPARPRRRRRCRDGGRRASSASAPPSTPTSTGCCSRM